MDEVEKIQQVVKCIEDGITITDGVNAWELFYVLEDLGKKMNPDNFHQALKQGIIMVLQKENIVLAQYIMELDDSLSLDIEVQQQARKYFEHEESRGLKYGSGLKILFGL